MDIFNEVKGFRMWVQYLSSFWPKVTASKASSYTSTLRAKACA
jgi:hypothetical protein